MRSSASGRRYDDGGMAILLKCFPPAGVTAIRPDELEFPNTMTDIDYDTWMLRYRNGLEVLKTRFFFKMSEA